MNTRIVSLAVLIVAFFLFNGCEKDETEDLVAVTVPEIKSKTAVRNSIEITDAQPTNSDGKIYVYNDWLFYIAQNYGIHIFNNQDPASPENMAFIRLEGVNDISVKNNILYADNFMDLVVFDISDISDIALVNIEEDLLYYYASFPNDIDYFQSNTYPSNEDEFIAGYTIVNMDRADADNDPNIYSLNSDIFLEVFDGATLTNTIGTGGSYAKFQIYGNALYTIGNYSLFTFDITDYNAIVQVSETWMENWFGGAELETTFIRKDYLFVGATNGMHIVGLQNAFAPTYTSSFLHVTGCDPVVVEENTAYITIRGGNSCGAIEDQINIIDISDVTLPVEYSTYFLSSPYGLGIKDKVLYVCNDDGINVFDAQNPSNIVLKATYNVDAKDIIPLSSHLIAVGDNVIHQYSYTDNFGLEPISTVQF